MMQSATIAEVAPDKATYRPGEVANVTISIVNGQGVPLHGRLALALMHLDEEITEMEQKVELQAGRTGSFSFAVTPPPTPLRGYGLDATLYSETGAVLAQGSGAMDVLERWSQAPRYGFLSDFSPEQETNVEARCESLKRYHLNAVQFYDWMWRHYKLLPPTEEFTDALDRRLSLHTVRTAIRSVQARGGAAMAYGAVYGAEPEYADHHPELRLYDEQGKPISLAELFYIMNIAPGSPWVDLIVAEFAETVREMGFDGIHLDQYGFPKTAYSSTGELVDLSVCFPPLIDRSRTAVVAERPDAGVIFNAVENWPIETVAATSQDAVYIEVWPPYNSYNDLRSLIREGKRLGEGKQVILAAYLSPFLEATEEIVAQAETAALLATATISASGGSHLLLGEHDGVLCDPYYPKYATMRPAFAEKMRAWYDFIVRYEELLVAPDVVDWDVANREPEIAARGVAHSAWTISPKAEPRKIWAIPRSKPGYRIVHLINLVDQADIRWNTPRTQPISLGPSELHISDLPPLKQVLLLTPERGKPLPLEWTQDNSLLQLQLPAFDTWAVLVFALADRG